jgi:hypothetical protein
MEKVTKLYISQFEKKNEKEGGYRFRVIQASWGLHYSHLVT